MIDQIDVTKFNATASCSKCTVRRRNEPISDRTTMQFLLNGQFALNAKSQKENEQKGEKKKSEKEKQLKIQKAEGKYLRKNARTDLYTIAV